MIIIILSVRYNFRNFTNQKQILVCTNIREFTKETHTFIICSLSKSEGLRRQLRNFSYGHPTPKEATLPSIQHSLDTRLYSLVSTMFSSVQQSLLLLS